MLDLHASARDELARFAVGPGVRLCLEAHAGAARAGEGILVCSSLDADTYEAFDVLANGLDGRGGDQRRAYRFLAASVAEHFLGVEFAREFARYGSIRSWFLCHPDAGRLADAIMPEYLEVELPDELDVEAVEAAVYLVLDEQDPTKNPYGSSHREGCERDIWADRDTERLLDPLEIDAGVIPENRCGGCLADRRLYARAIKRLGSGSWVDLARRLLQRSSYLEQNPAAMRTTSARDWLFVEIARAEVSKRDAYLSWQAGQQGGGGS